MILVLLPYAKWGAERQCPDTNSNKKLCGENVFARLPLI